MKKTKVNNLEFADVFSTNNQHIVICGQYDVFISTLIVDGGVLPQTFEKITGTQTFEEKHQFKSFKCDGKNIHVFGWDLRNSYLSVIYLIEKIKDLQLFFGMSDPENIPRVSVLMPGEGTLYCLENGDNRLLIAGLILEAKAYGIDLYMNPKDEIHFEAITNTLTTTMQHTKQ